jgi:hypothetical protein
VSPGGLSVDLSSVSGWIDAAFAGYQLSVLTATHFAAFALAGVVASLAFDWSRSGGIGRFGMLAVLCAIALLGTVALSSSLVVLGSIGGWAVLGMIVSAPAILGSILRVLSTPEEERPG